MSSKRYRIIFILIFMLLRDDGKLLVDATDKETTKPNDGENVQSDNKEGRALFPRLEYTNQWTPVGRGDPLKDPTYDYMPPVLDRVRYWAEGTSHKNKNDILLLGIPSKKITSMGKKEKFTYGPIKRNFYSAPYQSHFSSPHHHQQPYHPQRIVPPKMHVTDSHAMSTHHYHPHQQQLQQQQHHAWKTNNVFTEPRPENSIKHMTFARPTVTSTTRHPSTMTFLPTISPLQRVTEHSSTTPTPAMTTIIQFPSQPVQSTFAMTHQMMPNTIKDTTKPLLHSILQTETASPFTKKPSTIYQIEYTNIYNAEAINSMATSSTASSTTVRPIVVSVPISPSTTEREKHYVQPDMQMGWPVYNLIIEGHSKVKTYGTKNDDQLGGRMPNIRPVQGKDPVQSAEEAPEFVRPQDSAMTSLLSLLDGTFGNFLGDVGESKKKEMRKTRSVSDGNQERVLGVSFKVDERPQIYRKGTVIEESLWPFRKADTTTDRVRVR